MAKYTVVAAEKTPVLRDGARALLHRIDAWGIAFILAALALLIHDALSARTLLLLAAITFMYWFGYVVNDYWDAPFDAGDEVKAQNNFFVRHPISPNQALLAASGISAFLLIAFAQFGYQGLMALAVYLFIMWSYSAPPLYFKRRPVLDLLVHALFAQPYPYVVCLLLIGAAWTRLDYAVVAFTCLAALAGQLEQQIRDFAIDSETGQTFTTQAGPKTAAAFLSLVTAVLLLLGLVALANGTVPLYLAPYGLLAGPTAVYRLAISRWPRRSPKLVYVSMIAALLYTLWGFVNF